MAMHLNVTPDTTLRSGALTATLAPGEAMTCSLRLSVSSLSRQANDNTRATTRDRRHD